MRNRGYSAYILAALLIGFYSILYWTELFSPFAHALFGKDKWFLYGSLYTLAILIMGVRFIFKHRDSRYQILRTVSIMVVQVVFAFAIPIVLSAFKQKQFFFSYLWPLKIEYFYPQVIMSYPLPIVIYSFAASLIVMPILGYFYGKRWYCSWSCGCGGLANTFGDPFRHLSSKTLLSWKFERYSIHATLILAICTTIIIILDNSIGRNLPAFHSFAIVIQYWYGFIIGAILSGIVGVGFYPLLGTRVWCRFFCPMAALLGIIQRSFGRFRITTNGALCMECGLCSKYCEMGIDVRSYAQKGHDIKRASCVGCGICAHVCPRGVLKLESTLSRSDGPHGVK